MWWESLSIFQQVMFIIAVSASGVMVIFLILMLFGIDGAEYDGVDIPDVGIDISNDEPLSSIAGLRILTVRGALVFLSIGAWVAYLFAPVVGPILGTVFGIILGVAAAYLQALAFKATLKLESEGNMDYHNAIGKVATVYMRIPKLKSGKGKVSIIIQERFAEIDAVTDEKEDLLPKTNVEVIGMEDQNTLIVRSKS
jgi:membrane protein implicated in regulation of membrane protease activity